MVSNVEYARVPRIGFRTVRGIAGLVIHLTVLWFAIFNRDIFFFPLGLAYVSYGLARGVALVFRERGEDEETDSDETQPELVVHGIDERQRKPVP